MMTEFFASSAGTGQVFYSKHSDTNISDIYASMLFDLLNQNLFSLHLASAKDTLAGCSGRVSGDPGG